MSTVPEVARRGRDTTRLSLERLGKRDALCFLADDKSGRDAVRAIMARKHTTRARTLARRRETVDRAHEAAQALGWELTADERTMLEGFGPTDA
jgi:hypothetical protein